METIIPFSKTDYSEDGMLISSDKFIMALQREWEVSFHKRFNPYYANVIEGHPSAMLRLTRYMACGKETKSDFGMELINGKIDINTNLNIEKFSHIRTIYAIGSQLHNDEDNPLFLIKNERLKDDILVMKHISDNGYDVENENIPVNATLVKKS